MKSFDSAVEAARVDDASLRRFRQPDVMQLRVAGAAKMILREAKMLTLIRFHMRCYERAIDKRRHLMS